MLLQLAHRLGDGRNDVRIGSAATKIAAHQLADFIGAARFAFGNQTGRRTDLSGRAIAALEGVMIDERLLQRMQRISMRESFDGRDLFTILHYRERET